ncbi:LOW QUALITY PROTEIN: hypothetical protein KUTeg_001265, partial [Tegillarca granosa]
TPCFIIILKISVENEVDRAVKYIKSRRYETGMEILLKNRTGAKKAFTHIIQKEVRKEMFKLLNNKSSGVRCEGTLSQIKIFNWNNIFQELKTECPMLTSTLPQHLKELKKTLGLRYKPAVSAISTVGNIPAILAYKGKPYTYKLMQRMNSIQMWLSECKREAFGRFNHLAWCMGMKGTRSIIDKIRVNFDKKVKIWKENVSDKMLMGYIDINGLDKGDIDTNGSSSETFPYTDSSDESSDSKQPKVAKDATLQFQDKCGFSICFDNVNQKVTVRHQRKDRKNKMFNMVQAYCAKDRVPTLHLDDIAFS